MRKPDRDPRYALDRKRVAHDFHSMTASSRFAPSGHSRGKILVILHQENSTPARIGRLLEEMGYELDLRRPRFGDPLPGTLADHAGAVIFGGPMSANDPDDYIKQEIDWIDVPLKENKPAMGICLGAQIMARHLGERVYRPECESAEIGYYPLIPTDAGHDLCDQPFPSVVYQWHREGFGLPRDATLLAEGGATFPIQAFQYGSATAFQFHPEVTYAMMWRWTTRGHDRMQSPGARAQREHMEGWFTHDPAVAAWLKAFLDNWIRGESGQISVAA
jgi:GMP synthase (glutamine-hydrolysing)